MDMDVDTVMDLVEDMDVDTEEELCGFHLMENCRYGSRLWIRWNKLPYLWQIVVDNNETWFDFSSSHNQEIERDYCNVNKETSLEINVGDQQQCFLRIHFEDMAAKGNIAWRKCFEQEKSKFRSRFRRENEPSESISFITGNPSTGKGLKQRVFASLHGNGVAVRRLSTSSSVEPSPHNHSTHWVWYWTNDYGQWTPYDGADVFSTPSLDSSNEKLEKSYLSGADNCVLSVKQQNYKIDFKNMVQTNTATNKARRIRRRPSIFISEQDLPGSASRMIASPFRQSITTLPREWAPMTDDQEAVMITLDSGSEEYRRGEREFLKTMSSKTIHKIARVQNADLYDTYSRKLSKLTRKLGRPPEERHLFHGTSDDSAQAICQQGFDWRLCGVHGTQFGKGSYFAVMARYADKYAGTSSKGHKLMFLCKVIVGSYDVGNANTVRPPPRDPTKPHELHHSCVDKMSTPSIFVIFDNDQAYPEFLISYS